MPAPPARAEPRPLVLLIDRRAPSLQAALARLQALLGPPELERLERLRRAADRERFLLGRGVLRLTLGHWLGRDPAGLVFSNGPHGKPGLDGAPRFNLSHSGDLVLLAFHATREVGVDVERQRPGLEWQAIARRTFAPKRLAQLEALPASQREGAFLAEWCRLEAELKARGTGLAGLSQDATGQGGADLWDLALPAGHLGAVALARTLRDHPADGEAPRRGSRPG
ncbi:MAG: 4'-phosphopantetheinyl transferase family protein [Vulcanococcus sp.]